MDKESEGSRIVELAQQIKGDIVQMSENCWVQRVAQVLQEKLEYKHPITDMSGDESLGYIKNAMKQVDLKSF